MLPKLEKLIEHLRKDDILVVTRLDRLARSTSDLLRIAERLTEKSAGLQSLDEPWADTTSPSGRMVMTIFAGIAEFERTLIISRTNDGRVAAKARGVAFGRPKKNAPEPAATGQGTRPRRKVDQRRRQDLRRSPSDDLPRRRGVRGLMPVFCSAQPHRPIACSPGPTRNWTPVGAVQFACLRGRRLFRTAAAELLQRLIDNRRRTLRLTEVFFASGHKSLK
jgi:hypothetical protein